MLNNLSASEAADKIAAGLISSEDLTKACLERIEETDQEIKAWAWLDKDQALEQARHLDDIRQRGRPLGRLHGVPVGLKDIIDTKDMPTERGTAIYRGRVPEKDAALLERLKDAGAVVLGKTVTTEFAFMNPAKTRNPQDFSRSPGGSSSGSAAAVAAGQIPLAIGSQTNGSVIRPASFCGTFGFKPTRGIISRSGVLQTSETLDQIGVFGRTLTDAALLADILGGYDQSDSASYPRPRPRTFEGAKQEVPAEPEIAWFELPYYDLLSEGSRSGFEELAEVLGACVEKAPVPSGFLDLVEAHRLIHEFEICQHLKPVIDESWDQLSAPLKGAMERGLSIGRTEYQHALAQMASACDYFDAFFNDYDVILTPSAAGEAPMFEEGTGNPVFCTVWTLCGLPCITMPLLVGDAGLPVGVQLVGGQEEDARLFRTANWLMKKLEIGQNEQEER